MTKTRTKFGKRVPGSSRAPSTVGGLFPDPNATERQIAKVTPPPRIGNVDVVVVLVLVLVLVCFFRACDSLLREQPYRIGKRRNEPYAVINSAWSTSSVLPRISSRHSAGGTLASRIVAHAAAAPSKIWLSISLTLI